MKRIRTLFLVFAGLFMTFSFYVPPAQAFTSLQSCYRSPKCAKMLLDAGMIGGSTVPQGLVTTPGAAGAIARGAPAATKLFVPNFGNALGLGAGVAGVTYAVSQQQRDDLVAPYLPAFEGGQCPTEYEVDTRRDNGPVSTQRTLTEPGGQPIIGPVSGIERLTLDGGNVWRLMSANGYTGLGSRALTAPGPLPNYQVVDVRRVDGLPDDCGSAPPALQPNELPTPEDLERIFENSPEVPVNWPSPTPGPDGQPGTDDDVYPPLLIPGPTTTVSNDEAQYSQGAQGFPNESDPNALPNQDPNASDDPQDINVDIEFPPIDPPPAQSSGCSGWGYAICELSGKFPFDVVGDLPPVSEYQCPSFGFFGQTAEFCFIRDMLSSLKFVAAGSLVVYGVFNL